VGEQTLEAPEAESELATPNVEPLAAAGRLPIARQQRVIVYQDGVCMTESGSRLDPSAGGASGMPVKVPYRSTDVLRRLGSYQLLREIGRGGMGAVFLAYAPRLQRNVAVKTVASGDRASQRELVRFHNEAVIAARLRHPNIVTVFDSGEQDGTHYFVMDYIPGGSLGYFIANPTPQIPPVVISALLKTARALQHAHAHGVVHRDIKPDNILVDAQGEPHLTDFGVAKEMESRAELTLQGAILGTPWYMPPEQANGELERIGPHSDVYALGATMYHVLTGRPPFTGASTHAILTQVLKREPVPPAQAAQATLQRTLPPDLETIIQKAMEKEASRRYPTAAALADDLERFEKGEPISARPATALQKAARIIRRNRAVLGGALVLTSLVATVLVGLVSVTAHNLSKSSETLLDRDIANALNQAGTLERAIRVNMLQGRADQARLLLQKLNEGPEAGTVQVVRTDRKLAYTDLATRERVEKRLQDAQVVEQIRKDRPDFVAVLEMLQKVGFPGIDAARHDTAESADVDKELWAQMLRTNAARHYTETRNGEPFLVVMRPIENSEECMLCHAATGDEQYGTEKIRAVLVMRRSQAGVMALVAENRQMTLLVGLSSVLVLAGLMLLFHRVLGVRVQGARYGAQGQPPP